MNISLIINSVIRVFSKLHPQWFRHLMISFFLTFLSFGARVKTVFTHLRLQVFIVSGLEKQTRRPLRIVYVGKKRFPVLLRENIFSETPSVEQQRHVFIWRIKHLKHIYSSGIDAIIISCDQWYQHFLFQDDFFVFPHMVDMVLDTSQDLERSIHDLSHSAQEDVKKVIKKDFSYEISSTYSTLQTFYDDMYLPTLKNIVGETDVLIPDFVFLNCLRERGNKLMIIKHKTVNVCGVFFQQYTERIVLRYAGVLHGDNGLIKKGAFTAIYYLFMVYAKQQRVSSVDFGGTRPFFYDGLFQYKRKWGMTVEQYTFVKEIFGLKILTEGESLKQFLIHNPFIGLNEKNELTGFVFVDKNTFTDAMSNQCEKRYRTPGVNDVRFIKL